MALVEGPEIEAFLDSHRGWGRAGDEIRRVFEFDDFSEAIGFVTRVAMAAEKSKHHPDIDIRWNRVTLTLSTHSEGGITAKDLDLADLADGYA